MGNSYTPPAPSPLPPTDLVRGGQEIRRAPGAAVVQVAKHASGGVSSLARKLPRRLVLQDARADELFAGELSAEEAKPQRSLEQDILCGGFGKQAAGNRINFELS